MYQLEEYRPPPLPTDEVLPGSTKFTLPKGFCDILFWLLRVGGLIVWTYFVYIYGWDFSINSVINPVRHEISFTIFLVCYVLFAIQTLIVEPLIFLRHARALGAILVCVLFCTWLLTLIWWGAYHAQIQPYRCENMPNKFPVYVHFHFDQGEFKTGMGTNAASVYVNRKKLWQVSYEEKFGRAHMFLSAEYLYHSGNGLFQKNTSWPGDTAVSDIWTNFSSGTDGSDGTVTGTCGGRPCLEGKFWMTPNLRFEFRYINPETHEMKSKIIASDEGKWFFQRYQPLVSLRDSKAKEVFRAQATNVVCSAGDGDYETSLVPLGLMLLAEKIHNYGGMNGKYG